MAQKYDDIVKTILVDEKEILEICKRLGKTISEDYAGKDLVVVGMLKGGMPFMMDLIKHITIPMTMDFIQAKSYEGTRSTDYVVLKKDVDTDLKGKHVLIIDDVLDTAQTITRVLEVLADRGTASIELCCLLDKKAGRKVQYDAKYIGKDIPNEFVIGYGLDYNEYYRNLPYVAVVKDEVYK